MNGTHHVFEFLEKSSLPDLAGACAIFGSERFLKKLAIKHITEAIGGDEDFVPSEYDSNHASWPSIWPDVHDELSTRNLFGGNSPKIVLVDDADKFVTENRDRIHDYISQGKGSGLLVLIVNTWASNTKLYKLIDKVGFQVRCDPPKTSAKSKTSDEPRIVQWLIQRAKDEYEFTLPKMGGQMLVDLTSTEFGRMDQELQKLSLFADSKGKVSQETIKKVVGGWRARTMWDAVDAAADGDAKRAVTLLDQLLRSGEHPLGLFGQLSWSLRRYSTTSEIVMRQMRQKKKPDLASAVRQAGFRSWGGEIETAQTRIRQLGRKRAELMLDWLLEADMQLKNTHSKEDRGRLVLEKLFVRMAKELGPNAA
ncbi:DNA polymerase III subunit delta [bacterium]|nr:DNA polymerase III subunit delta [bacterium]